MEALHGPEWKDQLAMAGGALEESEEEEEEEEEERSHYSGQGTGRPGSSGPRRRTTGHRSKRVGCIFHGWW